jgi:hypothetical protein
MSRIRIFMALAAEASIAAGAASAQETIKIGAVQSKTGPYNPIGKQVMVGGSTDELVLGNPMADSLVTHITFGKPDRSYVQVNRRR